MSLQPPETNGVMELTDTQNAEIKVKLEALKIEFIPTDDEAVLATHGLVSRYNQANLDFPINGDTAEFILNQS